MYTFKNTIHEMNRIEQQTQSLLLFSPELDTNVRKRRDIHIYRAKSDIGYWGNQFTFYLEILHVSCIHIHDTLIGYK